MRKGRMLGAVAVLSLALGGVAISSAPAMAEQNHSFQTSAFLNELNGTGVFGVQTFYVYLNAGEVLTVDGGSLRGNEKPTDSWTINTRAATATVTDPTGVLIAEKSGLGLYDSGRPSDAGPLTLTAETSGVFTVTLGSPSERYDNSIRPWRIEASINGNYIPGRVFVTDYKLIQPTKAFKQEISFVAVSEHGYQYQINMPEFNGWNSMIRANAYGNVDRATCLPADKSDLRSAEDLEKDAVACGGQYLLFFEQPATDIPQSAAISPASGLAGGAAEHWVLPELAKPAVDDLVYEPASASTRAGELSYKIVNHSGVFDILVDADGDGAFDGVLDRRISSSVASHPDSFAFDGLDAQGNAIPVDSQVGFRVEITQSPEIHVVLNDVETMAGGVKFTRLNGDGIDSDRVYWNDSMFAGYQVCSPKPEVIDASVDGVPAADAVKRGWLSTVATCNDSGSAETGTWGNEKSLDTWTYGKSNAFAETRYGGTGSFSLEKRASNGASFNVGEEVKWKFTVANTGTAALSNVVIDDPLLGVDDWECVASLNIGESAECEAPVGYITTADDAKAGFVRNVAVANATAGPGAAVPEARTASSEVLVTEAAVPPVPNPEPEAEQPTEAPEQKPGPATESDLANTGGESAFPLVLGGAALLIGGAAALIARRRAAVRA